MSQERAECPSLIFLAKPAKAETQAQRQKGRINKSFVFLAALCENNKEKILKSASMNMKFPTPLLDSSLERKKQEREAFRLEMLGRLFHILERLSEDIPFKEAYIFGSLSKPLKFFEDSDIDIGFVGLADGDFFKAIAFLSREIGKDVDVVQLEGQRLAEKIKKEGIKWAREISLS